MPPAVLLGRFKHHFPGEYRSPAYRTPDGVIPFGLFWILYATMTHNLALDRVNQTRAITHAIAAAFGKKDGGGVDTLTRRELAEAFLGPTASA